MAGIEDKILSFQDYMKKITDFNSAIALLDWDSRTKMPKKGVAARSEALGTLSSTVFQMQVSPEMRAFLEELEAGKDQLDLKTRRMLEISRKFYDLNQKIPAARFHQFVVLRTQAEAVWQEAKEKSDFAMFSPYLAKIVDMTKEFIGYWGHKDHLYDTLLDMYEEGLTVSVLDPLFANVRKQTIAILDQIKDAPKPDKHFLERRFDPEKQRQFSEFILHQMGYDFDAGRLDETVHPFATGIAPGDVRVTTKYLPNFFNSALFGSIHEGGHALYEQNISDDLAGTPLHTGVSMGIHESQSRFWENIIGRSHEFWQRYFPDLQKMFPDELSDVTTDQFYKAVNAVEPSFIRIEADEVTYNLHIMLRYELEKALITGDLKVADLPGAWNDKMQDYLGITPPNDSEGVLQDVHWSDGSFGYFPSYSLGNIYGAQMIRALGKDIPDYREQVAKGEFSSIRHWLKTHIHQYGSLYKPDEILRKATGEGVDTSAIFDYFNRKFGRIYGF